MPLNLPGRNWIGPEFVEVAQLLREGQRSWQRQEQGSISALAQ